MQKRLFCFCLLSFGPEVWLRAQVSASTGAIQGIVVDQTGAVADMPVILTNASLGLSRETKTQGDGT